MTRLGVRALADPLPHDGRHSVLSHRHAVERVGDLHGALLVRDDDELTGCPQLLEHAEEAAEVATIFGEACCVPIHYEGWSHFREGKDDVTRAFQRRGLSSRLRWLPRGEPVELAP